MRLKKSGFEAEVREVPAACPGTYVYLEAEYERITVGFSALGRKGKPAEAVADEVYDQFAAHDQTGAALDPHLADQCLIFLLLQNLPFLFTTSRVTDHLETNIWLLNRFLPDREIELQISQNRTGVVRAGGAGEPKELFDKGKKFVKFIAVRWRRLFQATERHLNLLKKPKGMPSHSNPTKKASPETSPGRLHLTF